MGLPATVKEIPKSALFDRLSAARGSLTSLTREVNSPVSPSNLIDDTFVGLGGLLTGFSARLAKHVKPDVPRLLVPGALTIFGAGAAVGSGSDSVAKFAAGSLAVSGSIVGENIAEWLLGIVASKPESEKSAENTKNKGAN